MIKNLEGEDSFVQLSVKDNGVGMNKVEVKNLFKLFATMKNTRESNTQGIGLGLCISRMIVETFEGEIGVTSKPNHGSTFNFTFKVYAKSETFQTLSNNSIMT